MINNFNNVTSLLLANLNKSTAHSKSHFW